MKLLFAVWNSSFVPFRLLHTPLYTPFAVYSPLTLQLFLHEFSISPCFFFFVFNVFQNIVFAQSKCWNINFSCWHFLIYVQQVYQTLLATLFTFLLIYVVKAANFFSSIVFFFSLANFVNRCIDFCHWMLKFRLFRIISRTGFKK